MIRPKPLWDELPPWWVWREVMVDPDGMRAIEKLRADGCDIEDSSLWVMVASLPFLRGRRASARNEKELSGPPEQTADRQEHCADCGRAKARRAASLAGPGIAWRLYRCRRCGSQSVTKELLVLPHLRRTRDRQATRLARRLEACAKELGSYLVPAFFARQFIREPRGFVALPKKLLEAARFFSRLADVPDYRDLARTDAMLMVRDQVVSNTGRPHDKELVHLFFLAGQVVSVDLSADNEALKKLARRKREADRKLRRILAGWLGPKKAGDMFL